MENADLLITESEMIRKCSDWAEKKTCVCDPRGVAQTYLQDANSRLGPAPRRANRKSNARTRIAEASSAEASGRITEGAPETARYMVAIVNDTNNEQRTIWSTLPR